jgi:hypothetical protein
VPHRAWNLARIRSGILILLMAAFGLAHGRFAAGTYGPERMAGFHTGVIHGALMPAALPGLLLGNDLPIYAAKNQGRPYNIGYILGINASGTLFFGLALWPTKPKRTREVATGA